jgi:hypothetical protein
MDKQTGRKHKIHMLTSTLYILILYTDRGEVAGVQNNPSSRVFCVVFYQFVEWQVLQLRMFYLVRIIDLLQDSCGYKNSKISQFRETSPNLETSKSLVEKNSRFCVAIVLYI